MRQMFLLSIAGTIMQEFFHESNTLDTLCSNMLYSAKKHMRTFRTILLVHSNWRELLRVSWLYGSSFGVWGDSLTFFTASPFLRIMIRFSPARKLGMMPALAF